MCLIICNQRKRESVQVFKLTKTVVSGSQPAVKVSNTSSGNDARRSEGWLAAQLDATWRKTLTSFRAGCVRIRVSAAEVVEAKNAQCV